MRPKEFFQVFATLVEKVVNEPVTEGDVDFYWEGYFDSDMPEPSQNHCARLAAEDYLRENGYRHSVDPRLMVETVIADLVS